MQTLKRETEEKLSFLEGVAEKIESISIVLKPEDMSLHTLTKELEKNTTSVKSICDSLQEIDVISPTKSDSSGDSQTGKRSIRSLSRGKGPPKTKEKPKKEVEEDLSEVKGQNGGRYFSNRSLSLGKGLSKSQDKLKEDEGLIQSGQVKGHVGSQELIEECNSSEDENNPYAEIDTLRKQILQDRLSATPIAPSTSNGGGRPLSISGQFFNLPYKKPGGLPGGLSGVYESVEEVVPSPFLDNDLVS